MEIEDKKALDEHNRKMKLCADKFKLTPEDLHNLYDLFYIVNWMDYNDLKLNKMDKWFEGFFTRVEEVVIPELYVKEKLGIDNN